MANIPGINGYTQPGTFARDRVVSRAVSIPGGLRLACIMGEGLASKVLVDSAAGGGTDGSSICSPSGAGEGRYFSVGSFPLVSGRTQVLLNGTSLFGMESPIDELAFDGKYDFRLDVETGCLELQGSSIGDQNGKKYSASTSNIGNGFIADGQPCGSFDLISVIDSNSPPERWTIRCISVTRDSSGSPIPGLSTFTASGKVSGQLKDSSGQPILFHSTYFQADNGAISGNAIATSDGFIVAESGADFGLGFAVSVVGDASTETTTEFKFSGNLIAQGQALVGDIFCLSDGYGSYFAEITLIEYNSEDDETTLTVLTDSLPTDIPLVGVNWKIRATNLFIQNPSADYDDGLGNFSARDIGKVLLICSGASAGKYIITASTSSRRVRVRSFEDSSIAFPELTAEADPSAGIAEDALTYSLLETNGVLLFGIKEGNVPFEIGDKFFIDVKSRALKSGDRLEVNYISETTLNDVEFFTSAQELYKKHGDPSSTNTLSLGAQLAFQNGAPGVFAIQCKPSIPKRTSVTLFEQKTSAGVGGFTACGGVSADCEIDDLTLIIPSPTSGLIRGRPDANTNINFFIKRSGKETQIFPNKVPFYNSQLESALGQQNFISSSDYSYSYTVVNTSLKITAQGAGATLTASTSYFTSTSVDFSSEDVGRIIVLQSVESLAGNVFTTTEDVSDHVFGVLATKTVELRIESIINDNTAYVVANNLSVTPDLIENNSFDVNFFIKDLEDTTNVSAQILLNKDLVSSGTIKVGDGIRISYIDERDADFFDVNWFEALEVLEASQFQILVPLPTQTISPIFRAAVKHCEDMSTVANRKERMCYIGAQEGITTAALIGNEEIAIEDIGVLEGVQGDDVEEILGGNIEDLSNYKLSDNYTSNRAVYFYPDRVVTQVNGANQFVHGFYMAAAAAGLTSATQNVAIPLTFKELIGFTITRDRNFKNLTLNALGSVGATVVQPITGGGKILAGRTCSQSGFVEDEEISIMFIRDRVKTILRDSLMGFIGNVEDANTQGLMNARVRTIMSALVSQGLMTSFQNVRVEKDKVDPRQWNVFLRFTPSYPINYISIDIEVGI